MEYDRDHPLKGLTAAWDKKRKSAQTHKDAKFTKDADTAMRYFRATTKEIWSKYTEGGPFYIDNNPADQETVRPPLFRLSLNKTAEFTQLAGPVLYPANPVRDVLPRQADEIDAVLLEPMVQQQLGPQVYPELANQLLEQAWQQINAQTNKQFRIDKEVARVIAKLLNYTPNELDLQGETRRVIDETLIKGMSLWEHKLCYPYEGGPPIVGSFLRSVDDLLQDPDSCQWNDNRWIMLETWMTYWEAEEKFAEYGVEPGSLKKHASTESANQAASVDVDYDAGAKRSEGKAADMVRVVEVFSKMGVGDRLDQAPDDIRGKLSDLGKYSYIAFIPECPYPLNMPDNRLKEISEAADADETAWEQLRDAFQWPVPFWADREWPVTPLWFHEVPGCNWPMSHMKPGLSLLMFLNFCMGYLADKVRICSQSTVAVLKQAGEDFKKQFFAGNAVNIVEIEHAIGKTDINQIVSWMETPAFQGDIYKMIDWALAEFEKSIGLNELLYGMSPTQDRSAETSKLKHASATARIEDMHTQVLAAGTKIARKEALMLQWLMEPQDIAPIVGWADAQFVWGQHVKTKDMDSTIREFSYRLEADSARRPNRTHRQEALNQLFQTAGPLAQQLALGGNVGPWNGLFQMWGKLFGFEDGVQTVMLQPPDPNQPSPEQQQAQAEMQMEQQKAQQEMAMKQMELQGKQREQEFKMQLEQLKFELERMKTQMEMQAQAGKLFMDQQKSKADLAMQAQKHQMDLVAKEREFELKLEMAQMDAGVKQAQAASDMQISQVKAGTEMRTQAVKSALEMEIEKRRGQQSLQTTKQQSDAKVSAMKAQAKAKPKPKGNSK